MADPTPTDLGGLLALADTDHELRRARRRLDDLPEQQQLDDADRERARLEQARGDASLEQDRVQAGAAREDRQVAQLRERLGVEQQRMYGGEITNAKELQSMQAEIDAVQRRVDEHEEAELAAMEEAEGIEATMTDLDGQLAVVAEQVDTLTVQRDQAAQLLLAEIAELEAQRERQRPPLPADMLTRYDEVGARFEGRALGRLDGDQCSSCGIRLSYADVNALVEGPPLATCPSCQRLIAIT